ncbi:MAG: EAL domain-containing protein [Cyanophyceae cyanobacterium]
MMKLLHTVRLLFFKTKARPGFFGSASGSLVLLASVLVTGTVLAAKSLSWFQLPELVAYDSMIRLRPEAPLDSRLLIVGITEADIQNQKSWPLSDEVVAQLLEKLQRHQPRVIGLDLYRDIPHPPGTASLRQQLQADNVVAIYEIGNNTGVKPPPGVPEERLGFNDLLLDADNVLRRNLLYAESASGARKIYSFALQVSLHYLGDRAALFAAYPDFLQIGQTVFPTLKPNSGGYQMVPLEAQGWQTLRIYRSREIAPQISLTQALTEELDPNLIRGKAVLIGTTAPSEKDIFLSPYSATLTGMLRVPGVEAHARTVSQILGAVLDDSSQFWFWPETSEGLWIWAWSLGGGVLVWRIHRPLLLGVSLATAVLLLWGLCFGLFLGSGWVPFAAPAIALVATGGSVLAYKFFYSFSYDSLTGLANRGRFIKQLRQERHRHQPIAVIVVTLNRFKVINDSLGHQAGDQLLIVAANRLRTCLPGKSQLARVGNHEFALCLNDIAEIEAAIAVANCIQQKLQAPFRLNEQDIYTSTSLGIAYRYPQSSGKLEDLLQNAHIAMYRAKALGKQRPEVFIARMHDQTLKRWQLETDLRQALEHHEFELYYQPIVLLETGKLAGFEALIRWRSPERGFVVPSEFIPIAEETGLIIPIGQRVLRAACLQMKRWHEQFPHNASLTISVNLSPRQFAQPELLRQVQQTIADVGLDSRCLKLEITESMVTEDLEGAIALLQQLKALNLKLSIDDFGTGYSSLSTLHRFPIDTLKIDKSFVCRLEESSQYAEIVKTIVVLGHNLGLEIIAEGIETAAQMQMLRALGCEYGQGYLFAKPLSKEAVAKLIAQEPQWR